VPPRASSHEMTTYEDPPPIGIAFTPFETRADVILRQAGRADALGLARVDVAEGWTHDALILAAEIAQRTERIGIGTSVLSVWGRTPATLALGAAGLQRASGGRFALGLGAGSPPLAEGLHGRAWDDPLGRLRATLTDVRALLAGERLPHPANGARPLRLGLLPDTPVPLVLAALSDGSIRLAGELADGWAPFLWARSHLAEGRALLDEGAARAPAPSPTRTVVAVPAALAQDEAGARRLAAWWLTTYLTRMGPLYPRLLARRLGYGAAVAALLAAAGDDAAPALPAAAETLADDVTLLATHDGVADATAAWFAAGADSVSLVLPPNRPEEELAAMVEAAATIAVPARAGGA
jgi:alkanesulfonate monooxygenase SsuD/methylene tetrahydromethanopterin reductase-like flavin-dependent oxidoreductase (luciferase family)